MKLKKHPKLKGHKLCPMCGGWMWKQVETKKWICHACGFVEGTQATLLSFIGADKNE